MKRLEEEWQFQYTWCLVGFTNLMGLYSGGLYAGGAGVGVGGGDI